MTGREASQQEPGKTGERNDLHMGREIQTEETQVPGNRPKEKPQAAGKQDSLTGILAREAASKQVASAMNRNRGGALFLCDIDYLRRINDQHGHQAGDECLREVARILAYMTGQDDILCRCGGDEFFIFMWACRDVHQAQEICSRIEKRFRASGGKGKGKISFSVTTAFAMWQPGDTWQKLSRRAEAELEKRKASVYIPGGQKEEGKDPYGKDVRRIRQELIEQISKPGAYCQDYETFKGIYRFLERGIIRSGQDACVILITVVDGQGRSLLPYEKDTLMERLGEDIGSTLRIGDVYTRYSSSQYLLLVIDTTEGQSDRIVNRIKEKFLTAEMGNDILVHHCYELQPAKIGEMADWEVMDADPERG